jgi:pimeloyl-ACP methyl ester carboxylesterase
MAYFKPFPTPVVLVGHSLGGLTVSAVAEAMPERLSAVVYLTAFLPPLGVTTHTTAAQNGDAVTPLSISSSAAISPSGETNVRYLRGAKAQRQVRGNSE